MQLVKESGVAVAGGYGQSRLAERGVDGGRIGKVFLRDLVGLRQNGWILAVVAEDAEEVCSQFAGVG